MGGFPRLFLELLLALRVDLGIACLCMLGLLFLIIIVNDEYTQSSRNEWQSMPGLSIVVGFYPLDMSANILGSTNYAVCVSLFLYILCVISCWKGEINFSHTDVCHRLLHRSLSFPVSSWCRVWRRPSVSFLWLPLLWFGLIKLVCDSM